ncbi:MSCRAMM family protein [Streptomyces hokutonensis]|uniref:MSCRAMM family protein n=1 Tax=Streptomyces hokutonensis TaxID=1306990 RepID=UPI00037A3EF5|nr:SpaA isopeptide-forming pilin-related protein [Streptomyces hokutonensis]
MHVRFVRSAAVAIAVTGTLTWAPAASAQSSEPTPSASAALGETPAPDAGSVEITTKDTAGDALPGAAFLLLDSAGQEAGRGKTDAQGKLAFPGLAPGVYRLKETASGSPLHEVVADQDVIVTPGATTRLTITDPFKAAKVLLQAKDDKTGRLLPGATVNIGIGESTLLTLTTGAKGTASGELPVSSRKTQFWVKEIKAPAGYDLYKLSKTFTAGPGAAVTVTVTNSKGAIGSSPDPTAKPTDHPTASGSESTSPTSSAATDPDTSPAADASGEAMSKAPTGSLAHTGADASPWLAGGAGLLAASGIGLVVAARIRRSGEHTSSGES